MQLWFLSVILNVIAGLVLVFSPEDASAPGDSAAPPAFFENRMFRLVVGCLAALVGLLKLGFASPRVAVVGDLLPAAAGLAAGFSLLVQFYAASSSIDVELPAFIRRFCFTDRKYIGIVCVIVSVLHFVFPQALFL
jgi:hypothetical protein